MNKFVQNWRSGSKNMVTTSNYFIYFDKYSDTVSTVSVLDISGKLLLKSKLLNYVIDKMIYGFQYLLFDNVPMFLQLPMSNTLYRYGLYACFTPELVYVVSLIRENLTNDKTETIIKEKLDNFELGIIITELIESYNYLNK